CVRDDYGSGLGNW
nr:immunoglobulin heavy chain junction region [Macaca mulatta]MOV38388.1 immunoglobulin heavy chain junction region [Macaca mulatta]MOV39141.1 immunoglobulin heavy chain junction region [Macaca mulatta]MOV39208.1 immunoglobulin heavy chain junction region [Macaca mulatta]MOV39308.1 immunoglobulin heavy chain junction region [Macaca mulatta]